MLTHEVKQLGDLIPPVMMELVVGIKEASAGDIIASEYSMIVACIPSLSYSLSLLQSDFIDLTQTHRILPIFLFPSP